VYIIFYSSPWGGGGDFKAFGKGFKKEEKGKGRKKGKGDFKYLKISKYICMYSMSSCCVVQMF